MLTPNDILIAYIIAVVASVALYTFLERGHKAKSIPVGSVWKAQCGDEHYRFVVIRIHEDTQVAALEVYSEDLKIGYADAMTFAQLLDGYERVS
jgi:hypothetical protein